MSKKDQVKLAIAGALLLVAGVVIWWTTIREAPVVQGVAAPSADARPAPAGGGRPGMRDVGTE